MGNGIGFRCGKCGYSTVAYTGIGFGFARSYQAVVCAVREGKFGREWQELFESVPGAAVNADGEFYVCSSCGRYKADVNGSLYEPAGFEPEDGMCVTPWDLKDRYRLVKRYPHLCECGKRMHKYRSGDKLKCPECSDGWMEFDPSGCVMWD